MRRELPVVIVIGREHFLVQSRTREGYHAVDLEENGCSCESFGFRGDCWHWQLFVKLLGMGSA